MGGKREQKDRRRESNMESKKKMRVREKLELETVSRKFIKPSTATPPHLQTFKLSLLDQLSPNLHGNTTFFYLPSPTTTLSFSDQSQILQTSLSHLLTLFYPLAGRLHDPSTIHCNDHGAFFVESRTQTSLSHILTEPDFETLQCFLPTTDKQLEISNGSLLLVRFTLFGCGSTALTVSLSHKITDISTLITFLKTWMACAGAAEPMVPDLTVGSSLFPWREIPGASSASVKIAAEKFTTRRFVFAASKIEELKQRVKTALEFPFQPSRVEVVLALIWKCALSKTTSFKPSALFQAVNLRRRMNPAVSDTAVGNFVWPFAVTVLEESHVELHVLVTRMRKAMMEFMETKTDEFKEEGAFGVVMESLKERAEFLGKNKEMVIYKCSSWCKFPIHKTDFGWGDPVWTCSVNNIVSNTIALMDTKDGGVVEAFVTLDEQDMPFFQHHPQLLHYALLNPTVI